MSWLTRLKRRRRGACAVCGAPIAAGQVDECGGQDGDLTVRFRGLPVLTCGHGDHPKTWIRPDFGTELIDQVLWKGDVPVSRTKISGRQTCFDCGAPVSHHGIKPVEVSGTLKLGVTVVEMDVSGPGTDCEKCGCTQLFASQEVSESLTEAAAAALQSIDLEP